MGATNGVFQLKNMKHVQNILFAPVPLSFLSYLAENSELCGQEEAPGTEADAAFLWPLSLASGFLLQHPAGLGSQRRASPPALRRKPVLMVPLCPVSRLTLPCCAPVTRSARWPAGLSWGRKQHAT